MDLKFKSKLEHAIELANEGFFIFPCSPNEKKSAIKGWKESATRNHEQLTKWFAGKNFNIGIYTGKYGDEVDGKYQCLIVVDIDNKNGKSGSQEIQNLGLQSMFLNETYKQVTPNDGFHYFYRNDFPVKSTCNEIGEGIDIKSGPSIVLGRGSVYAGKQYKGTPAPVAQASDWLLEMCAKRDIMEHVQDYLHDAEIDVALAHQMAKEYMESIPMSGEGSRNNDCFKHACTLKDYGVPKNDIFDMLVDYVWCEPPLENEEIMGVINSAFGHGRSLPGVKNPSKQFTPVMDDRRSPLDQLLQKYSQVAIEAQNFISYIDTKHDGLEYVRIVSKETFLALEKHMITQLPKNKKIAWAEKFLESPDRRIYNEVVFDPKPGVVSNALNKWIGFPITAKNENEVSEKASRGFRLYLEHVKENIASGNEEHYNWVINYLSHMIQFPWDKPGICLTLIGEEGTGKNAFMYPFKRILGNSYTETSAIDLILGSFNSSIETAIAIVLDEAHTPGDKKEEGALKALITSEDILINAKFVPAYSVKSCCRVFMLTNNEDVLKASKESRRYTVLGVGNKRMQDHEYFEEMISGLDAGGTNLLFKFLQDYKVDVKKAKKHIETKKLSEQRERTAISDPVDNFLVSVLRRGYFEGMDSWPDRIDKDGLYSMFTAFCRDMKIYIGSNTKITVIKRFRKYCPSIQNNKDNKADRKFLILPTLEKCIREAESYLKFSIEDDEN